MQIQRNTDTREDKQMQKFSWQRQHANIKQEDGQTDRQEGVETMMKENDIQGRETMERDRWGRGKGGQIHRNSKP